MGLMDFFKKGKEEPAKGVGTPKAAPAPGQPQPGFATPTDKQPAPSTTAASQDMYTVQSGDSLSKIAKKHYGNANAWTKIYQANKDTIGNNPDLIKPGQRFVLPKE